MATIIVPIIVVLNGICKFLISIRDKNWTQDKAHDTAEWISQTSDRGSQGSLIVSEPGCWKFAHSIAEEWLETSWEGGWH